MLGEKRKEIRESNGFVQRLVAAVLGVDIAYVLKWKITINQLAVQN